ncbi:hypothetical protein FUAX_37020 [Fulvitalea axinellae]|uniref:N-acetyltransferase domain-containing protein n=1 Tax=Fulvitalea axinellae TaxID=1182444 RepID=A0AAU9CPG3_9BACT|nr:hypothetical protein FUAX_37020 [Fulvitalea axinellae]
MTTVRNLYGIDHDSLVDCFLKAFDGYFVKMPTDPGYYKERWRKANVRLETSYGLFDGNRLVGFSLHGTGGKPGDLTAYNVGSGVLPEYRGKGALRKIYSHAVSDLRKQGCSRIILEVIQENTAALKSYEKTGFSISKELLCFSGKISLPQDSDIIIKEYSDSEIGWDSLPNQKFLAWNFGSDTIKRGGYRYFQIFADDQARAYLSLIKNSTISLNLICWTKSRKAGLCCSKAFRKWRKEALGPLI